MTSFRVDLLERCFPEPTNSAGPVLGSGRPVHVETLREAPASRGATGGGGGVWLEPRLGPSSAH